MTTPKQPSAEEIESYRKWLAGRATRKNKGSAKRIATQTLVKTHQAEFDKLLADAVAGKLVKPAR